MSLQLLCLLKHDTKKAYETTNVNDFSFLLEKLLLRLGLYDEEEFLGGLLLKYCLLGYESFVDHISSKMNSTNDTTLWNNCLFNACRGGHRHLAKSIVSHFKTRKNWVDWPRALRGACYGGKIDMIEWVMPNTSTTAIDWMEPFYWACASGCMNAVEFVMAQFEGSPLAKETQFEGSMTKEDSMAKETQPDEHTQTAKLSEYWNRGLIGACEYGHITIGKLLYNKLELVPGVLTLENWTMGYHLACKCGDEDLAKKTISNINTDDVGEGFLVACKNGHSAVVELILNHTVLNADVWNAAIVCAYSNGHTVLADELESLLPLKYKFKRWSKGLDDACKTGNMTIVQSILDKGAIAGDVSVGAALMHRQFDIARLMIELVYQREGEWEFVSHLLNTLGDGDLYIIHFLLDMRVAFPLPGDDD